MARSLHEPFYLEEYPKPFLDPGPKHTLATDDSLDQVKEPPEMVVEIRDMSDLNPDLGYTPIPFAEFDLMM